LYFYRKGVLLSQAREIALGSPDTGELALTRSRFSHGFRRTHPTNKISGVKDLQFFGVLALMAEQKPADRMLCIARDSKGWHSYHLLT
jgi:hypothetical protein